MSMLKKLLSALCVISLVQPAVLIPPFRMAWAISNQDSIYREGVSGTVRWSLTEGGKLTFEPVEGSTGQLGEPGTNDSHDQGWYNWRFSSFWHVRDQIDGEVHEISSVEFRGEIIAGKSLRGFLRGGEFESIDLSNLDTSNTENFEEMFRGCVNLKQINISQIDTSNAVNMSSMFSGCAINEIDLSQNDLKKVTTTESMFSHCNNLKRVVFSPGATKNVTNMSTMFSNCSSLDILNLSTLDTSSCINMEGMFRSCNSLSRVNTSGWDTAKVRSMKYMFYECPSLESFNFKSFDYSSLTNADNWFGGSYEIDTGLREVILVDINFPKLKYLNQAFSYNRHLKTIRMENLNAPELTETVEMCASCSSLNSAVLDNVTAPNLSDLSSMFRACTSLDQVGIINLQVSDSKNIYFDDLFHACQQLEEVNISLRNKAIRASFIWAFRDCTQLKSVDLSAMNVTLTYHSGWTESTVQMFDDCNNLENVDLSSFDFSKVESRKGKQLNMWNGCQSLKSIKVGSEFKPQTVEVIPTPTSSNGMWFSSLAGEWYTPEEIFASRQGIADTYTNYENEEKHVPSTQTQPGDPTEPNLSTRVFTIGRDNNSFLHSSALNDYAGFKGQIHYDISETTYNELTRNASWFEKFRLNETINRSWGGSCFGIAATMGLAYIGDLSLKDLNSSNTLVSSFYNLNKPYENYKLYETIMYYQLLQHLNSYSQSKIAYSYVNNYNKYNLSTYDKGENSLPVFLQKLVDNWDGNDIHLFTYSYNHGGEVHGHAILEVGVEERSNGDYNVLLYDENTTDYKQLKSGLISGRIINMYVSKDFKHFSFIDGNNNSIDENSFVSAAFYGWGELGRARPTALYVQSLPDSSAFHENRALLLLKLTDGLVLSNTSGQSLRVDNGAVSGDMPVYSINPTFYDDECFWSVETDRSDLFYAELPSGENYVGVADSSGYVTLSADDMARVSVSPSKGVVANGDISFDVTMGKSEDEGLFSVEGSTMGGVEVSFAGNGLSLDGGSIADVVVEKIVGTHVVTHDYGTVTEELQVNSDGEAMSAPDTGDVDQPDSKAIRDDPATTQQPNGGGGGGGAGGGGGGGSASPVSQATPETPATPGSPATVQSPACVC